MYISYMFGSKKIDKLSLYFKNSLSYMSSKNMLEMCFLTMSGFQTRHIFCYHVTWTLKTSSSSEAHPLRTVCTILHSLKGTDWVAIWKHGIIRPFWFEDDNEHCVTINTDRYVQVLRKFWTSFGRPKEVIRVRNWFQQEGATPHTSKQSLEWLNQRFFDQLISRKCDPQWAPYSPD